MTSDEFRGSLSQAGPPSGLEAPLLGLWWDAKNDWTRAHEAVAEDPTPAGAWVHAYLHRKEGDLGNARYWYRMAKKPIAAEPLPGEWSAILSSLLP